MIRNYSVDSDDVELVIRDTGDSLRGWTHYSYTQDFTTPTDAFSFTLADRKLVKSYYEKLLPGTRVSLVVNGKTQCTGIIDKREKKPGREGTFLEISGRDAISPIVDAGVDPLYQFTTRSTLNDVFLKVCKPFGIEIISTSDIANRSIITGNLAKNTKKIYSPATFQNESLNTSSSDLTKNVAAQTVARDQVVISEYDPTKPKFLKDFAVDQLKPHSGEGCFEFLARLAKRFHLFLWSNATGDQIIVGEPDFDQAPTYSLRRAGGQCNFLDASYSEDATDQPSVMFVTGIGANLVNSWTKLKIAVVNEFTGCDPAGFVLPSVQALISARKGFKLVKPRPKVAGYSKNFLPTRPRPMFIHDEESRTFGQLEGFAAVELAKIQSKAFELHVKVQRHTQNDIPWCVNTIVSVDDEELDLFGPFWIKNRTFSKGRDGTFTELVLIPPYTMMFS